ncbi:hypothetical protein DXG03_004211 [Asterophora parasitica]|uniref:SAP domain-containing protein n=1 Tax=Asterophora parasitica TaxID=117018 RepID=A0A9P7GCF9_9AGAR|nr:hypothetical protein DXG03_004211 [Asterophora parasitica]
MSQPVFTGALMPKKKSELQEISAALSISDQGTKDDLQTRIKKHLEENPDLEENPTFSGLYGNRRKRSIQPMSQPAPRSSTEGKPTSRGRRGTALERVREFSPDDDRRDVSMFLKNNNSPAPSESTPHHSPQRDVATTTPSSLPPLPFSPIKSFIERITVPHGVDAITSKITEKELLHNSVEMVESFKRFLSNSRNIWSLTAVVELLYLLYTVIPWQPLKVTLGIPFAFEVHYPPLSAFQSPAFWLVLLHWAVPTLIAPIIVGSLISFNPVPTQFDNLTASIIRLAAHVGYPYTSFENGIQGLDVLGSRWRVLNASVGLAFAFAEAISVSPQAVARTLKAEQRVDRLLDASESASVVGRRALMPASQPDEDEVD